ncbi:MAG TPA: hypothetical protein VG370_29475 [Chloroflexota bacterium]|jgi:hypothetical protein|nr:hypothetical protein [Chloroflexota bacterium]
MSGSLLTRAADATVGVAGRPVDEMPEAPAGALRVEAPPRGITPRHNPPIRRPPSRPEAAVEAAAEAPASLRLAEAIPDGPRPAPRERRWWRLLGDAR